MKKISLIITIVIVIGGIYGYFKWSNHDIPANFQTTPKSRRYTVYKGSSEIAHLDSEENAITEAKKYNRTIVKDKEQEKWVYSSLQPYLIFDKETIHDFEIFDSALRYAKKNNYDEIYFKDEYTLIWKKDKLLAESIQLQVPHLLQMPELDRGCEVTSLAMILNYNGYNVSKMELAEKVKKDETTYYVDKDGTIHYGNPYNGFVGDIYDIHKNGYGVYHGPITELAREYAGENAIDITGADFQDILYLVEKGNPVWTIVNGSYKLLPEEAFEIWNTPTGLVKITKRLHSVVITGYDKDYIYINDPLYNKANRKVDKKQFQEAWEQMGNQAVAVLK